VNVEVSLVWERLFRQAGDDQSQALVSEQHAQTSSYERQDERFGEKLADDADPAGSNCRAHGKFMLASGASCQQQNGDIPAANGQQQCHCAKEQIERFAYLAQNPVAQVLYGNLRVVLWIVIGRLLCEFLEVGLKFRRSGFRCNSLSELHERAVLFVGRTRELQREINVRAQKSKMGWHDANDVVGFVYQLNGLAHDRPVPVVVVHPELVAQYDDGPRLLAVRSVGRDVVPA